MQGNAKSLKRTDEACEGILNAPSKLPRHSLVTEILSRVFLLTFPERKSTSGPISRRGWQADIPSGTFRNAGFDQL
jgi:hypothetical protein